MVQIEVGTFNEDDASSIDFTDRKITVHNDGDVFDIRITLKYRMQGTFRERLTLECRISATNADVLKSTTQFDLLFTMGRYNDPLAHHSDIDFPLDVAHCTVF